SLVPCVLPEVGAAPHVTSPSHLASNPRAGGAPGPLQTVGEDVPGEGDVGPELRGELVETGEALLGTEPLDEIDSQYLAVEVAFEVEQMGFQQRSAVGPIDRRSHADVHGGAVAMATGLDAGGVHA